MVYEHRIRTSGSRQRYRLWFERLEERDVPADLLLLTLSSSTGTETINFDHAKAVIEGTIENPVQPPDDHGRDGNGNPYELTYSVEGNGLPEGYREKPGFTSERWIRLGIGVLVYESQGRLFVDIKDDPFTGSVLPAHDVQELIAHGLPGDVHPRQTNLFDLKAVLAEGQLSLWAGQVSWDPESSDQPRFDLYFPYQVVAAPPTSPTPTHPTEQETCCRAVAQEAIELHSAVTDAVTRLDLLRIARRGVPNTPAAMKRFKRAWRVWEGAKADAQFRLTDFVGRHPECRAALDSVLGTADAIAMLRRKIRWLRSEHRNAPGRVTVLRNAQRMLSDLTATEGSTIAALAC